MACKFHAAMRKHPLFALIAALVALPALADKADRGKPLTIEADQPGTIDLLKQVVVFNGNVVIAQGTMTIRADRVEVRESPDGFRAATAIGNAARPASFRQKREGVDEQIEGSAERIEYEGRGDVVRFIGRAAVRRLRGGTPADEITGNVITYDNTSEVFNVQGGANNVSPTNPTGRVRAVLVPRDAEPAASAAAPASAALRSTPKLGERR
jgi:lipopolysaccharide export system protein LptA